MPFDKSISTLHPSILGLKNLLIDSKSEFHLKNGELYKSRGVGIGFKEKFKAKEMMERRKNAKQFIYDEIQRHTDAILTAMKDKNINSYALLQKELGVALDLAEWIDKQGKSQSMATDTILRSERRPIKEYLGDLDFEITQDGKLFHLFNDITQYCNSNAPLRNNSGSKDKQDLADNYKILADLYKKQSRG